MSTDNCVASVPARDDLLQCPDCKYLTAILQFQELLARIAERYPSRKVLAALLDMDASRLTRAINTGDFPFNVENCLRLAKLSGESPSEILRAADKADVANLIETLYGKDRTKLLSVSERMVLDRLSGLDDDDLDLVMRVLDRFFSSRSHHVEKPTKRKMA